MFVCSTPIYNNYKSSILALPNCRLRCRQHKKKARELEMASILKVMTTDSCGAI